MPMFRKKPVVIEARQYTRETEQHIIDWVNSLGSRRAYRSDVEGKQAVLIIDTLEGSHKATPGDWIIKGVAGEFYPCKPDIFEATYDEATS